MHPSVKNKLFLLAATLYFAIQQEHNVSVISHSQYKLLNKLKHTYIQKSFLSH